MDIMKQYIEKADKVVMNTYNRYPVVLDYGKGMYLYDINGKNILISHQESGCLPWDITMRNIMQP